MDFRIRYVLAALVIFATVTASGSAVSAMQLTCFKNGERVSGLNKICSYDCGGSGKEETVRSTDLCSLSVRDNSRNSSASSISRPTLGGMTCFKSGERTTGMNKVCYYNCAGSEASTTIGVVQLCPLSMKQ